MGQVLVIKNKGLNTAPNEFSSVPEGSMVVADNCSIDQDNVVEPRRGFARYSSFSSSSDRARKYNVFQDKLIVAYGTNKLAYDNNGTWVNLSGTHENPDASTTIRFSNVGSNCYFTTSDGVKKLDAYNGVPALSGVPKALDIQLSASGASGFLVFDNQVAYRMVWGLKDSNGRLFLGAPSGRTIITNSNPSGSVDVSVTFTIPNEITTDYFYQIYRTSLSGGQNIEPSDECNLVYENSPSAAEITAKTVTFIDSTLDSLRGATLYTSPSQEGILQSNERPPICKDIASYQDCLFFANCKSKQRLRLTLISASKLSVGNVVTIAGTAYVASLTENISTNNFELFSSGTPAQNIANTADSLIRVINRNSTNTSVYATLLSGANDLPGQIMIEERGIGGSQFFATCSANGDAFSPVLQPSGTETESTNDDFQHQLFYSKVDRFEAVPLLNYVFVGSRNNKILRIVPLKSSLFIFKEDEGIYRLTGSSPQNFSVEKFDSSANLIAPESVAVVNNQVWCLSDQGVITITETGVQVVSRPIEDLILGLFGDSLSLVKTLSFGVGYETDRRFILFTVKDENDTTCTQAFAWNTFTRTFTRWNKTATTALVSGFDKKLYIGEGSTNYTLQERKTFTYADYVDHEIAVTVTDIVGKQITLASAAGVDVGDVFAQGDLGVPIQSIINNTITIPVSLSEFVVGSAKIYKAFETTIEYSPITAGNPGILKQWPEISLLLKGPRFFKAKIAFATDISGSFDSVELSGLRNGLWGAFPWAGSHWGIPAPTAPIRIYVPSDKQYGSYIRIKFTVKEGFAPWKLNGVSVPLREINSFIIAK